MLKRHGSTQTRPGMTPLERAEALYQELVAGYGDGADCEIRAASKLLMVALFEIKAHGGPGWQDLVKDFLNMLETDPERYRRMLEAGRGQNRIQGDGPDASGSLIA